MTIKEIIEDIKIASKRAGWSIEQLAEKSGRSTGMIHRQFAGMNKNNAFNTLESVLNVLGMEFTVRYTNPAQNPVSVEINGHQAIGVKDFLDEVTVAHKSTLAAKSKLPMCYIYKLGERQLPDSTVKLMRVADTMGYEIKFVKKENDER